MKVEVAVLGSLSLMVPMISVHVKQHWTRISLPEFWSCVKVEVDVLGPSGPYGLCGRKATLNSTITTRAQELCDLKVEVAVLGSLSLVVLNGFRGRNAIALCVNRCLLGCNTVVTLCV